METLAGLWLPIVVSSVLVFVASSLIWNVRMYSIPYCPDPAMMKDPAFKEKLEKGPVAALTAGTFGWLWPR